MAQVRGQLAKIDCLPVDLSLLILDNLPDIKSLVSAAYAVPSLYRTLLSVDSSVTTRILHREFPTICGHMQLSPTLLGSGVPAVVTLIA